MGSWNRYFCRKCPYEAFVSGGIDVGMAAELHSEFQECCGGAATSPLLLSDLVVANAFCNGPSRSSLCVNPVSRGGAEESRHSGRSSFYKTARPLSRASIFAMLKRIHDSRNLPLIPDPIL